MAHLSPGNTTNGAGRRGAVEVGSWKVYGPAETSRGLDARFSGVRRRGDGREVGKSLVLPLVLAISVAATVAAAAPVSVTSHMTLSDKVVQLVIDAKFNFTAATGTTNYELSSPSDSNYATPVAPSGVGINSYVTRFAGTWSPTLPQVRYNLNLIFPHAMKRGTAYALKVKSLPNEAGEELAAPIVINFTYDDTKVINGSVKANQVGYLPNSPKYGYVGNYLGSAGVLQVSPTSFQVCNASTHAVVFTGTPSFRAEETVIWGEKIYDCDFSQLTTRGTYYLLVPGVGRTYNFDIQDDIYDPIYKAVGHFYLLQRCGGEVPAEYAGPWARGSCHHEDGIIHSSVRDYAPCASLYGDEEIGEKWPVTGGWHDAGDYGKYVPTAASALFELFLAYELFPEKFKDGDWNTPESGNGIPDILDECKWEVDWLRNMQSTDGGVFHKINIKAGASEWKMPEQSTDERLITAKTTYDTANYAAVMASASRIFKPYWPAYASDCLARAERAWQFLEAHTDPIPAGGWIGNPAGISGGEYTNKEDWDDRAWAAAELYKATGKDEYHIEFERIWPSNDPMWPHDDNLFSVSYHQRKASLTYLTTKQYPTSLIYVGRIKGALRRQADRWAQRTNTNYYHSGPRLDVKEWIGWGSSWGAPWLFVQAACLLGETSYLDYAKTNFDPQLGNNPNYRTYITGFGSAPPKDPLHLPAIWDNVPEPPPGIPVFGPHYWMSQSGNPFYKDAYVQLYPAIDGYPAMKRYWDCWQLVPMSEFSIDFVAMALIPFAYFGTNSATTDSSAPSQPVNLTGVARGTDQVELTWDVSQDAESGVSGYQIYRDGELAAVCGPPPFTDRGLSDGTTYRYEVTAFNAANVSSPKSNAATVTTVADTTPPALIKVRSTSATTILLVFDQPVDAAVGSNPANYTLEDGLTVQSAYVMSDGLRVVLTTSPLTEGFHNLSIRLATDRASTPNSLRDYTVQISYWTPGDGLLGSYYANKTLTGTPLTRVDPQLNVANTTVAVMDGIPIDNYSVRWTGFLLAEETNTYTVSVITDDGVRMWVDGQKLADRWVVQGPTESSGSIFLTEGRHSITVEYFEQTGGATVKLYWSSPSMTKTLIPQRNLTSTESGPVNEDPDTSAPTAGVVETPATTKTSPLTVNYSGVSDTGNSGLKIVRLWARKDAGAWADTGMSQTGGAGSFAYTPSGDGTYFFAVRAEDNAGNASAVPSGDGQTSTRYDGTAPAAGTVTGSAYAVAGPLQLSFSGASDGGTGLKQVALWYKKTATGSWFDSGLKVQAASGSFSFAPSGDAVYYFAVQAEDVLGNKSPAPSGSGQCAVTYDTTVPQAGTAQAPKTTKNLPVTVRYSGVHDAVSGVKQVILWMKLGSGSWTDTGLRSTAAPDGSFPVSGLAKDGKYTFFVQAEDKAGLKSSAP